MRVLARLSHNSTWGPVVQLPPTPPATARDKLVTNKEERMRRRRKGWYEDVLPMDR